MNDVEMLKARLAARQAERRDEAQNREVLRMVHDRRRQDAPEIVYVDGVVDAIVEDVPETIDTEWEQRLQTALTWLVIGLLVVTVLLWWRL